MRLRKRRQRRATCSLFISWSLAEQCIVKVTACVQSACALSHSIVIRRFFSFLGEACDVNVLTTNFWMRGLVEHLIFYLESFQQFLAIAQLQRISMRWLMFQVLLAEENSRFLQASRWLKQKKAGSRAFRAVKQVAWGVCNFASWFFQCEVPVRTLPVNKSIND